MRKAENISLTRREYSSRPGPITKIAEILSNVIQSISTSTAFSVHELYSPLRAICRNVIK